MAGFTRAVWGMALGVLVCATPAALCFVGDPPAEEVAKKPEVFADLTLAEAQAKAKGTDKVVVADFTADWCAPCKLMDRTSWRDAKVVKWLKTNAIAVQIDVEKSRDVAQELHITAMPTVMIFRNGELLERRLGYQMPDQLLGCLAGAAKPKKVDGMEAVVLPAPGAGKAADVDKMTMQERLAAARGLADNGKFEDATAEYVWLWKNIAVREPAMVGVRGSFMASDMQRLAAAHKPARIAFTAERDRLEARLKTDERTFDDLDDWIVLNDVVGQPEATLAWFERIKNDADSGPTLQRVGFRLKPLLEGKQRWADLGRLESDPLDSLKQSRRMWRSIPAMPNADAEFRKHMEGVHADAFRRDAAILYVGQLACGKADQAAMVLDEAVKLDPSGEMRMALVEKALDAHVARRSMLDQLDAAEKAGADAKKLRERLLKELGEAAG